MRSASPCPINASPTKHTKQNGDLLWFMCLVCFVGIQLPKVRSPPAQSEPRYLVGDLEGLPLVSEAGSRDAAPMHAAAEKHLIRTDAVLAGIIRKVGPCALKPEPWRSPFQSLVQAVAHQQLNGKAAETILGRFRALFSGKRFPQPKAIAGVSDEALRAAGFSRAKVAAIRDIAARVVSGEIPGARRIEKLSDDEIIERLTAARGVGRWTVEMLLMFQLGRPDVMPADDFGVRSGYRIAYGLDEMPKPRQLLEASEPWRPHRTVAAWYLWRAVDLAKQGA